MDKSYTILLVADRDAKVKKIRLEHRTLVRGGICLLVVVTGLTMMAAHYFSVVGRVAENAVIRAENLDLQNQWREAEQKFKHINEELDRVKRLNANLRHITRLNDPERKLALGPIERPRGGQELVGGGASTEVHSSALATEPPLYADGTGKPTPVSVANTERDGDLLKQLDELDKKIKTQEKEARSLKSYFEDQQALLASAPSIWPVRGWVTSDFSVRLDPYTGERVMHEGLDVAAALGSKVRTPADGTVVFNGVEGGYGRVLVVDHGYGLKTRFGHLLKTEVKVGDKVRRGQIIAQVGNSGRSTGPHLHYEVRVNGVADNPRKFILEE